MAARFLCVLLMVTLSRSAPVEEEVVYDQRQNGTENYRLHVDGVVVAVAPAETLLSLIALADDIMIPENLLGSESGSDNADINALLGLGGDSSTTESAPSSTVSTPADGASSDAVTTTSSSDKPQPQESSTSKPTKKIRGKILLSRLLMPLLRHL